MGEAPQRIFVTGAPGLDGLEADAAMDAQECRARLGLPKEGAFALAVFHPVVQQAGDAYAQTAAMLQALSDVNLPVLWLEPNADAGSLEVLRALDALALPSGSPGEAPGPPSVLRRDAPLHCDGGQFVGRHH